MRWSELEGQRVVILGTGREGVAIAEHLLGSGVKSLSAADERDGDSATAWRGRFGAAVPLLIAPTAATLRRKRIQVAIASPGIPPHSALRRATEQAKLRRTTATDLWLGDNAARTTAVTGSKGKSTTAALVRAISVAHGVGCELGGNIGIPLLGLPEAERYAAELSSYQCSSVTTSPDVVVLTALFPEHLDWHATEWKNNADKLNLIAHGPRRVLANGEDPRLVAALERFHPDAEIEWVGSTGSHWTVSGRAGAREILRDGARFVDASTLPLVGRHNLRNAALALAAVEAAGTELDPQAALDALAGFRPLEHRLERVADPSGLVFIDDSLSTSPFAAIAALEALDTRDLVLIVGGQDRGVDYAPLADYLQQHPVAAVIGLPDSGPRILKTLAPTGILTVPVDGMDAAIRTARKVIDDGVVLLSPAAPSYGRYRDYADRAADFRRAISASASA